MSNIQRALLAASFIVIAATAAQAQAPGHSGGAVAIGSDNNTGAPAVRPQAGIAAPAKNYGAVAVGADSASGAPAARIQAVPARTYQGSTVGVRAIGSDR